MYKVVLVYPCTVVKAPLDLNLNFRIPHPKIANSRIPFRFIISSSSCLIPHCEKSVGVYRVLVLVWVQI